MSQHGNALSCACPAVSCKNWQHVASKQSEATLALISRSLMSPELPRDANPEGCANMCFRPACHSGMPSANNSVGGKWDGCQVITHEGCPCRPTKHRASAKPCARQSHQLHVDTPVLEALPQNQPSRPSSEAEAITTTLRMLALPSDPDADSQDSLQDTMKKT